MEYIVLSALFIYTDAALKVEMRKAKIVSRCIGIFGNLILGIAEQTLWFISVIVFSCLPEEIK